MVDRPSKPLPRALGNSFPQLHWGMSSSRVVLARQSKKNQAWRPSPGAMMRRPSQGN